MDSSYIANPIGYGHPGHEESDYDVKRRFTALKKMTDILCDYNKAFFSLMKQRKELIHSHMCQRHYNINRLPPKLTNF